MIGAVRSRALALPLAIALMASACSGSSQPDGAPGHDGGPDDPGAAVDPGREPEPVVIDVGPGEVILTARLVRFDECDALLKHLRSEAAARVGPWGFGGRPDYGFDDMMVEEEMAEPAADEPDSAGPAADSQTQPPVEGVDYSGTNVQEAGVDEADIIKTDGRRIFAMSAGRLIVLDAARREVLGSVRLAAGESAELFLHGDSLLAIQHTSGRGGYPRETVIERIDVRAGVPEIVETIRVQGDYVSARSIGGTARVILRSQPSGDFPFVYPGGPGSESIAEEANSALLLDSTLEDWAARLLHHIGGGHRHRGSAATVRAGARPDGVLRIRRHHGAERAGGRRHRPGCRDLGAGPRRDRLRVPPVAVRVHHHLDRSLGRRSGRHRLGTRSEPSSAPTSTASTSATPPEPSTPPPAACPERSTTSSLCRSTSGHLRVVTTTGDRWSGDSQSWVRVLAESDGQLTEVGSVGDIGRGERVQSVRFAGDVGYVVTFRQVDPFYTVDLSDPTDPTVVGRAQDPRLLQLPAPGG